MLTAEQTEALEIARALVAAGIPVFTATPDPSSTTGYRLPPRWQQTRPDPAVVDAWQPGMALAVVMGQGLDLIDVDPRSGGDPAALNGSTPASYGAALTPSGGVHSFIRSLGVRSRDNVLPGIDVKAGDASGTGRGFAFIAPTVRVSKVTGEPTAYRWAMRPDTVRLAAVLHGELLDDTGAALRDLIAQARSQHEGPEPEPYTGPPFAQLPTELQHVVSQWVTGAVEGIVAELKASADWPPGQTDDRGRGWEKLQADAALRLGQLARASWNDLELADAESAFLEAAPVDGTWGTSDAALKWAQQSGRLEPAAWPNLTPPSEREAESWAALGVDTAAVPLAAAGGAAPPDGTPPVDDAAEPEPQGPPTPDVVASRYFGDGGLQAITLAGDVLGMGPLRIGRDDIMWSYRDGVWGPHKHVVRDRLTWLMGQRFRTGHTGTVEAIVRAYAPPITCEPVSSLVNFTNGLLDWRTGELAPHSPDVTSTVQLGVDYVPDAECPAFERYLAEVVPEDVVETVWELIGYLMYSGNPLHKAVMLTGTGRNGKGTFLRVLQTVLGRRNITNVSLHDLVNTRFSTVNLFGKLANIAGDIDAGYMENTATFKQITGGDTISAEHKGRDRFDFTPWAVPLFSANKIPASADTTVGYLSRWLVIAFPNSFIGREDRHLDSRLHQPGELQGIAARGIAALPALLDRGDFRTTLSGERAREEFIRRVDQVRTWLADCCELHPDLPWTARSELYEAYKRWAGRDGHKPVRASEFYDRIEAAGAEPAIVHGTRGFKRIRVIDSGWAPNGTPYPSAPQTPAPLITGPAPTAALVPPTPTAAPTEAATAPTTTGHVSAGQPASFHNQGAEGAETPHPPSRAYTREGGLEAPAPSAPSAPDGDVESGPKPKSPRGSAKASEAAAEKREAARREAIAAAGAGQVDLPAVVTRDGSVMPADLELAEQLLATVQPELTVDVETTGFPVGHQHYALRTVQLGNEQLTVVLDPDDPGHADVVRRHVAAAEVLHAHSATADLIPLQVAGLLERGLDEAWSRMHDTVIPAKLADPASTGSDPGLKKLAAAVLRDQAVSPAADDARAALFKAGKWLTETKVTTALERSGWAQVDSRSVTMVRYAASDVLDDAAIARRLPAVPAPVLERERLAQRLTARVAYHGLRIDGDHTLDLLGQHQGERQAVREIIQAKGVDNPGSNDQVAAALERLGAALPRTATGKASVREAVLTPLSRLDHPAGQLAREVLTYRSHDTAIGTFLEPYLQLVAHGDGRARPTVYTLGADTGRMSCVRPNLQQVPREGGFRACITADPGTMLVSADFAGVELRAAAALSGDRNLRAILEDPERDLHWEIARLAFGPQATKADRYAVKRGVFGRIYGGGVAAIAAGVGVTESTAQAIIDALDALLPELTEWSRMVREAVKAGHTQFPTYAGRVAHLDRDFPHKAPNYCIQGTARELLIDALVRWSGTRWGADPSGVLLPVHDELVVVVPEDDAEEATAALVQAMTTELNGVPIKAEASQPSFAWADAA